MKYMGVEVPEGMTGRDLAMWKEGVDFAFHAVSMQLNCEGNALAFCPHDCSNCHDDERRCPNCHPENPSEPPPDEEYPGIPHTIWQRVVADSENPSEPYPG